MATANATCPHAGAMYQFWMLAPGAGSWAIAQAYSTNNVFNWTTTGLAAGVYHITVWARDASSPGVNSNVLGTWDTSNNQTFTLTTQPCTSVANVAAPASSTTVGTPVTFTATAMGCPNAHYQFWMLAPGSTTWVIVQAYSPNNVFNWVTTGKAKGVYRITVWARDNSSLGTTSVSTGTFDTSNDGTYTLT
jgi:hypothetical protein